MTTTDEREDEQKPAWTPSKSVLRRMLIAFGIGAVLLGIIGFAVSFENVSTAARPYMHWWSWALPTLIDLGIFVLSGLSLVLELHRIGSRLVRLIPTALAAFTVYLNIATQPDTFGKAVHAAGPALWILVVEVGTFAVRRLLGLSADDSMDKVRPIRWLLAPLSTFRTWRRMRVWEIRDYSDALTREQEMHASRALLREWHGKGWRRQAPSAQRLAVRLQASAKRPAADLLTDAASSIMAAAAAAGRPITSDGQADEDAANRAKVAVTKRPTGRPKTADATAKKVVAFAAKNPGLTTAELAKKLKLSPRTITRHLANPQAATALIPAQSLPPGLPLVGQSNGHALTP